jgi:hypothetical protein
MPAAPKKTDEGFLKVGALINLDRGGRTLQNLEVLGVDDKFIKVKWDVHVSPQTEVVLVPIDGSVIGLVGER